MLEMEVDTGSAVSIISNKTWRSHFPDTELEESNLTLTTYTDEKMKVLGVMKVKVQYEDQGSTLRLFVVKGAGPSLLGREWLNHIRLNWKRIGCCAAKRSNPKLESLLSQYPEVFRDGLGTMNTFRAKLNVQTDAQPRFWRPRPVPFALRRAIDTELTRLEEAGIVESVT